jgi:3-oxoacyl-[acyl-carrier-protein] synthase II
MRFNIQGFNSTLSTGFCSSPDAIYYAMNMMALYDYNVVLAGGIEELCEQTYKGFYKIGHLAGSRPGKEEIDCPFDKRRNGIIFGEGAAIFVLEEMSRAKRRGARIYAELLGYGTAFDPDSKNIYSPKAKGAARAIKACLEDAGLNAGDIGYVSAGANSTLDCDAMEVAAVKAALGHQGAKIPASSIKSMIGETYSAGGAMNLAVSLGVLDGGVMPPTINYREPDRRCEIDCVPNEAREKKVKNILINSFSPTGSNSVLAVGKS